MSAVEGGYEVPHEILDWLRENVFNADVAFKDQREVFAAALQALPLAPGIARERVELGGVACEVLSAPDAAPERAIVYAHGGGYCIGSPAMGHALGSWLARALRAPWYGVDYRLAPEHRAPAAVEDVASVIDALAGREVVAVGDSAGAGAIVAALARGGRAVRAMALVSPWLDLASAIEPRPFEAPLSAAWVAKCARAYAGEAPGRRDVSPIDAAWSALAPALVVGASDDLVAGDARRLAARGEPGVVVHEYAGLWHDFALWAGAHRAADEAAREIAAHLARHAGWAVRDTGGTVTG